MTTSESAWSKGRVPEAKQVKERNLWTKDHGPENHVKVR
jgi:hypothetical protein